MKTRPTPFALRPITFCVMAACCELAAANPTGASVAAGSASFQNAAKTLTVTNTPGTIINWQGFSIGGGETTRFLQQSAASAVLNRVVGPDPSSLLGTLSSNGRVFLINTNGIVVGAGARIDTAGFIASTLNIGDQDFLQGRLRFEGGGAGALKNAGTIRASGDIMLVGPQIENTGIIRSDNGAVLLAAGRKLTITSPDAQGVKFELQSPTDSALNMGTLDARTAATMFAGTLHHSGDIRVGTATDAAGHVTLVAQKDAVVDKTATIVANGTRGGDVTVRSGELTWVEGSIEAKGSAGSGGTVKLLGEHVGLAGAKVDASGETGGGTILVGGDYQGKNADVPNAKAAYVDAGATIKADALTAGDGGKVIVWSDGSTRFDGAISARGGAASGDGGFVETSGHEALAVTHGRADTRAPAGQTGTWLLDPNTINVTASGGSLPPGNVVPFTDQIGMPVDVAASAINAATSNVTLQANTDVNFDAAVSIAASGVALTAQAGRSINVNQDITTNNGNVTLIANETTANGVFGPDRLAGAAVIQMAAGKTINAGNANVILGIAPGFGHLDTTSGNITVANITAGNIAVEHNGPTANGKIVRADASSMLTGSTSVFLQMGTTGSGGSIGSAIPDEPIRVTTPALEALLPAAAGGIFISGTGDLGIGGVPLSIYGGTVRGVQANAGGPISITTTGNLTHSPIVLPSSMCGPGTNMGSNPICAVGVGGSITLSAATIGATGGGRLQVQTSGAGVSAESTSGGVFLQQVNGTLNVSNYSLSTPTAQAIELANLNGSISVDVAMPFATRPVTLVTGSADTSFGAVTIDASTLTLSGGGAARFDTVGATAINAAVTIDKPVGIAGGTATFNNGGTLDAGVNLASGGFAVNGGNATTINGGTLAWSGGTIAGNGTLSIGGGATVDLSGSGARVLNGPSLTAANMNLGGGSLDVQAGTLALPGTVTLAPTATLMLSSSGQIDAAGGTLPSLVMSGGTLSRSTGGDLTIAGDFNVSGGAVAGSGNFITQGHTTISGVMFPQRNWLNDGTLDIATGGRMSPSPGGGFTFTNQPLGTVNVTTNLLNPFGAANEAVVMNQGTMNVTPPGPDAMTLPNAFTNAVGANLNVTAGTLDLQDARTIAGNVSIPGGTALLISDHTSALFNGTAIAGSGTVQVRGVDGPTPQATFRNVTAANAALDVGISGTAIFDTGPSTFGSVSLAPVVMPGDVAGALTANTGLTINGALDVRGTATFNGATTVGGTVTLNVGTLGGTGAFSAPTLSWNGGTIQGNGVKTFTTVTSSDSQGSSHFAGNVALAAGGSWTNNGTLAQDGAGQLVIGSGATVSNPFLSNWNVTSSVPAAITGSGTFNNGGSFSSSGGSHAVTSVLRNTGFVNVADGTTLTLGPGAGAAAPDIGVIGLNSTGTIDFAGDRTLAATSTISGSSGGITVSGGTLVANGAINTSGPFSFTGGSATFNAPPVALTPSSVTVGGGTAVFFRPLSIANSLTVSSGRGNFNEPVTVGTTLTLSFGTLGGTGPVGVTGLTTWSGGGMDGNGTTTANGGLAISGPATKALALDRRLTIPVSTTATWTGTGNIVVSDGSRITNLGEWLDQSAGATIFGGPTGGTFFNQGLYRRAAGDGSASSVGIRFDNGTPAASVEVQSGTLRLGGGGTSSRPFSVTGTLDFAGGYTIAAGSDITGSGSVVFSAGTTALDGGTYNVALTQVSGGTANFNAGVNASNVGAVLVQSGTLNLSSDEAIAAPTLSISGGTLSGSDTVTVSGATTWTGGTMAGSGSTTTNGTLAINGPAVKQLDGRALNNTGTATWTGVGGSLDRIATGNGASINNSGTWNDQTGNGAHIANDLGGTMSTFNNTGNYVKSANAGSMSIDIPYNANTAGATSVQTGTLRLTGGGTSSRPFGIASGATLEFGGGTYNLNAGSDFTTVQGGVLVSAGTANFNGGTYDVTGGTTVTGGTAAFSAGETVVNVGPVTVSQTTAPSTLTFDSGETVNAPSLNLSGGTLGGTDTVNVSGATSWSGGTMTGAGITSANGNLAISGNNAKNLNGGRTLNNTATATWTGSGAIATGSGATINNSGTWQDQSVNATISNDLAGAASAFNNTSTYTKSTQTGTTVMGQGVAFNNNGGTVNVDTGTLRLAGGGTSSGTLNAGATLEFSNAYNVTGGSTGGAGTVLVTGPDVNFSGGTYNVTGATTVRGGAATFNPAATVSNVGALTIAGGTLTLSSGENVAASSLDLQGGTLTGTDTVNVAGATAWGSGAMTGSGVTNANGGLTINGVATKTLDGRTLNANVTSTWSNAGAAGQGRITTGNGARINNNGTWQDQTVGGMIDHALGGAASTLTNAGSYVKSVAGTTTIDTGVMFDNTGVASQVNVQNGTLLLRGGGTSSRLLSMNAGAVLDLNAGSYDFNSGTSVSGAGTLRVSGATLNVNTPLATDTALQVSAGILSASQPLTLNGALSWSGGTITGAGALTTNNSTTVSGPVTLTDKAWQNNGNVTVSGTGMITLGGTGAVPTTIENESSGVFNVATASAGPIITAATGNNKSFSNEGRLDVTAAPAGALFNVAVTNTNSGTINVNGGTVTLPRFAANDGTLNIASGATAATGGNPLTNNGTVGGAGTLNLGAGNALTNLGTLRPGAATGDTTDTLTITGNLVQGAAGQIDLEFGGTAARAFDALAVSGTAVLAGTVNVSTVGGYTPAIGDAFPVISAGTRVGNFSTVNKTFATNMTAAYGATSLTFTIGGGPINSWISGSGDWSVGGNWSLGHVPTTTETALLDQPGTLTITIPTGTFATDAVTSNENLAINSGTLALSSVSTVNAALGITGGTLQTAGTLNVNGPLTLSGGTISGGGTVTVTGPTAVSGASQLSSTLTPNAFAMDTGSLTINPGGVLNLTGSAAKTMTNARLTNNATLNIDGSDVTLSNGSLLENAGTLNLDGAARIAMNGAGATELANRSGGIVNDRSTNATAVSGGAGTRFTNAGTFNKTTAAAATQSIDAAFDNAGTVNVDAGTLTLTQGGADSGVYNLPGGTVLDLASGARDFNTGVGLTGAGTLRVSGATLDVNTPITQASGSPALELTGGVVNNAAGVALNGAFTWSGGTVTGTGTLTTGTTAATTVSGTATLSNTRWTNFGPIALNGAGRIVLEGAGTALTVLDNRSGGVITDTSTSATPIGFAATRGSTAFDNSGRFIKASGSAATQTLDVPMTNSGRIDIAGGTLAANGLSANAGAIVVAPNATFSVSSPTLTEFANTGDVVVDTGASFVTGGARFTNTANGTVQGNGTFDVGTGVFFNGGIVAPGASPGTLTIAGNYTQGPAGQLLIEVNGPQQGIDYDLLKVTGNAALDGTLVLHAPGTLAPGTPFQVITYASHTGDFATKVSSAGVPFDATPGPTSYEVTRSVALNDTSTIPILRDPGFFPPKDPPRDGLKDQHDPKDPREERRRVLPECR